MTQAAELIANAKTYATETLNSGVAALESANSTIAGIRSYTSINDFVIPTFTDVADPETPPAPQAINFAAVGTLPAVPTYLNLPALDTGELADFTKVVPTMNTVALPAPLRTFLNSAPAIDLSAIVFPSPPSALNTIDLTPPTIAARTTPAKPTFILPTFDAVAPTFTGVAPENLREQFEASYRGIAPVMVQTMQSHADAWLLKYNPQYFTQLAKIESRLSTYLDGGTALTPAIENQIAERARDKVDAEYRRTRDVAYGDAAKRGFTIPDGALLTAVTRARQAGADNNSRAAVDIAVKQAELEQQNLQFAVTTSMQLRTTAVNAMLSYHGGLVALNGQAVQYAQFIITALIQVYDLLIKSFNLQLDIYKTAAAVFDTKMRAVQTIIEIYRVEIEALKAQLQVDLAQVDIYKARIESLQALASVYKTQVEAIVAKAGLEKLKIELFGAQVQAFDAEARAKASEYQGYNAALQGEQAKLTAFGEEARAYGAKTDAFRIKVQAKSAQVQSITSFNEGLTRQYVARVGAYSAINDATAKVAAGNLENYRSQILAFQAKMQAIETVGRLRQSYFSTVAQVGVSAYSAQITNILRSAELSTAQSKAIAEVATESGRISASLAGAALSGMNALAIESKAQ